MTRSTDDLLKALHDWHGDVRAAAAKELGEAASADARVIAALR